MIEDNIELLLRALQHEKETNTRLFLAVPHERLVERVCALWAISCKLVGYSNDPIVVASCGDILDAVNNLVKAYNNDESLVVTCVEEN